MEFILSEWTAQPNYSPNFPHSLQLIRLFYCICLTHTVILVYPKAIYMEICHRFSIRDDDRLNCLDLNSYNTLLQK